MTMHQHEAERSWWDNVKRILLFVIPVAALIWLFGIATEARGLAQTNAGLLRVPIYQLTLIPGGPVRFADEFEDALEAWAERTGSDNAETPALDPTEYLWATFVVRNVGELEARDLSIRLAAAAPVQHVMFTAPGWSNDVSIEHEAATNEATIDFEELNVGDEAMLFMAMTPQAFEKPYDEQTHRGWARDFELYFEEFEVESNEATALLYGHGYVAPSEEETEQ
jgi:hypothetical protein